MIGPVDRKKAAQALKRKGALGRFWIPHYSLGLGGSKRNGEFVGLACSGCNYWEDSMRHDKNCSVADLEKFRKRGAS